MLNRLLSTLRRGTSSTGARTGRGGVGRAGGAPTSGGTIGNLVRGLTRRRG